MRNSNLLLCGDLELQCPSRISSCDFGDFSMCHHYLFMYNSEISLLHRPRPANPVALGVIMPSPCWFLNPNARAFRSAFASNHLHMRAFLRTRVTRERAQVRAAARGSRVTARRRFLSLRPAEERAARDFALFDARHSVRPGPSPIRVDPSCRLKPSRGRDRRDEETG